jgi:hypothetical protein
VEWIVRDINQFLRGWAGHFKYGNSARHFSKVRKYALERLVIVIAERHKRSRAFGFAGPGLPVRQPARTGRDHGNRRRAKALQALAAGQAECRR